MSDKTVLIDNDKAAVDAERAEDPMMDQAMSALEAIAAGFYWMFAKHGAKNFVQLKLGDGPWPPMMVTVQRLDGKSPANIIDDLRAEVTDLKNRNKFLDDQNEIHTKLWHESQIRTIERAEEIDALNAKLKPLLQQVGMMGPGECGVTVRHIPPNERQGRIHTDGCTLKGEHQIHSITEKCKPLTYDEAVKVAGQLVPSVPFTTSYNVQDQQLQDIYFRVLAYLEGK